MAEDHWRNAAWSENVTFDLKHKTYPLKSDVLAIPKGNLCEKAAGPKSTLWELDAQALVSSPKWLQLHGLKRNKLTLSQILAQIGFLHKEDYVPTLGRPVSSRYGEGLFHQYSTDGRVYNLTARNEEVLQVVASLTRAVELYRQRMDWLTSESRKIFGVIQERCVAIVLDFGSLSKGQFDLCREALCLVLKEQVSHITRFNLIWTAEKLVKWQEKTFPVTAHAINSAVQWIWKLEQMKDALKTGSCEAVLEAMSDKTVEAVYYFAAGDVPEGLKQLLLQKLSRSPCPIHTVSFNSTEKETLIFMKELSQQTDGRFHAFSETTEYKNVRFTSNDDEIGEDLSSERMLKGGTPPGAGVREDVFLIWQELEEARNTLIQVQGIAMQPSPCSTKEATDVKPLPQAKPEDYVSSKEWLQKYSFKSRKLTFYDALADCAFRHSDGVVEIKTKPENESLQTDAEKRMKLVNAKYCDRFVHAHWKDGSVVHVYVSSEKCRWYEERMKTALEQMERRVKWLQHGSRELFGTVLEDQVCILIDTSQSMKDKLSLVKEKIFQLMQEQLRHKEKFNFVKFDARVAAWKEKLSDVNEENLENAWFWVKGLQVGSSTNTLKALQLALADRHTQAVYLLTDGRPDQPPETIMAQIQFQHPVPIHSISFNCDDTEANGFLYELSNKTGGRFHCYSSERRDPEAPQAFVSEDIHLLMNEIEQGKNDLEKVQKLYAECLMLDWYHNGENDLKHKPLHNQNLKPTPRPQSAVDLPSKSPRLHRHELHNGGSTMSLQRKKALHAEQTRTSLLRTLYHGVKLCENETDKWMLPEKKELFVSNNLKSAVAITELMKLGNTATQKKAKRIPKQSLDMSSSRWLKTHGLIARRLTIMDALAPTAVPHTAKYIPILNKRVLSKVFDQVLPIAHVSGNRKLITLINPLAVNLNDYKEKVERAVKSYERRLNLIIWRALSQDERDKFESLEPIPFKVNKEALLQALDRLGWPVSSEDVTLLEDEIETGDTYIHQATELQQVAKAEAEKGTQPKAVVEGKSISEESTGVKPKGKERKVLNTLKGQRVIARSEVDGFYYPGTVQKCVSSKHVLVDLNQGDTQITPIPFIIPVGGALPCPPLQVGDCVFCKNGTERGNGCYVPAIVIATPRRSEAADKLYSVLKYNNRKEHTSRRDLVKISQAKFAFSCRYIQETRMIDYTIPNVQIVKPIPKPPPQEDQTEEEGRRKKRERSRKAERKHRGERRSLSSEGEDILTIPTDEVEPKKTDMPSDNSRRQAGVNVCYHKRDVNTATPPHSPLPILIASILSEPSVPISETPLSPKNPTFNSSALSPSAPTDTLLGRKSTPIQTKKKLKEMEEQLHQNQIEQREKHQKSQAHLEELAYFQSQRENSSLATEQKELKEKQVELLQQLRRMTTVGNIQMTPHQEKAADNNDNDDPSLPKNSRLNESRLLPGQNVLSRSSENGWYTRGSVVHACGDQTYFVRRNTGEVMRIWRDDIFSVPDDAQKDVQEEDPVIGLHPLHPGSYCPGVVLRVFHNQRLEIRYYDGVEALVPRYQIYLMTPEMFARDLAYIVECEERWVGQPVIARDDKTGTFHLAEVQERVGDGRQYVIRWAAGRTVVQKASWIFGRYSPSHVLNVGDHVLALAYPTSLTFLPAVILDVSGAKLLVRFCNGESSQHVEPHLCFGLSEEQFNMAAQMYRKLISEMTSGNEGSVSEDEESVSDISTVSLTPSDSEEEYP